MHVQVKFGDGARSHYVKGQIRVCSAVAGLLGFVMFIVFVSML